MNKHTRRFIQLLCVALCLSMVSAVCEDTKSDNNLLLLLALKSNPIYIGGSFTEVNGNSMVRVGSLNNDGSPRASFYPGTGANNTLRVIVKNGGRMLVGGDFGAYNETSCGRIARINADGSLDASFNSGGSGANGGVNAIAVNPDGKIYIAGNFSQYNGTGRQRIARLNADGSLDTSFDTTNGADAVINTMAVQEDGKIVIGGDFLNFNAVVRQGLARVNTNGSLDMTFNTVSGANEEVNALAIDEDGKVVIGGAFTSYGGTARNFIARISSTGALDTSFNPGTGCNSIVFALAIGGDGNIVIGGNFTTYNASTRQRLARITPNGTLDSSFDSSSGVGGDVFGLTLLANGKILISGVFVSYAGTTRNYVARINDDGSLDDSFDPAAGPNGGVNCVVQ